MREESSDNFDLPSADPPWLTLVIQDNGEKCGNCGQWRVLSNPLVETCPSCGDEGFNIYEMAAEAVDVP